MRFNDSLMTRSPNMKSLPLSDEQLKKAASAVFAMAPAERVTERYSFLPTIEVVSALRNAGWQPIFAAQGTVRDIAKDGIQRHVVRFRHPDMTFSALSNVGDVSPELVLLNSHNGSSAFQLHAGLFRLVCGNGMVVADSTFAKLSIKHSGTTMHDVVDASFSIVKDVPQIGATVEAMRSTELNQEERLVFAEAARKLRWEEDEKAPVSANSLLAPRRICDDKGDLWHTFNKVQENLVRGGLHGRTQNGKRTHTRAVNSVHEDTRINKALWHLAEEMRKLKN